MREGRLSAVSERQAALLERMPVWRERAIHEVLDEAAGIFAGRPLVITSERQLSYEQVMQESMRIAAGLREAGIGPADKVALILGNFPEYVTLKYAIARLGAVAVPINILLKADELRYVLDQSDAKLLITMDMFRGVDHLAIMDTICEGWESAGGGAILPALEKVIVYSTRECPARPGVVQFNSLDRPAVADLAAVDAGSICDILYTSGTTGPAKGVQLTHDMLMRTAFGSAFARAFEDRRRILFSLPMYHVFGYVEGMLSVPFVGGAIIPQLRFDAAETLRAIDLHRATDALLIPAMSLALIDEIRLTSCDLSSFASVLASGGKAPARLWAGLRDQLGVEEITTGYGMTETTASTTVTHPDDPLDRLVSTNGRLRQVGPAADPQLPGLLVEYRVVDTATGEQVSAGEMGELQARGIGVTRGYYNKPAETAEAFTSDGWLRTGDLGRMDAESYISLIGRTKESYRCGGEQVLPSEVEEVLGSIEGVRQAHVAPLPDERMGEVGVAFIVPTAGALLDAQDILDRCQDRMARFKVPRHVLFVEEADIPLTASGRAKKFLLTELASRLLASR